MKYIFVIVSLTFVVAIIVYLVIGRNIANPETAQSLDYAYSLGNIDVANTHFSFYYPKSMNRVQSGVSGELIHSESLFVDPVIQSQPPIKIELAISVFDNSQKQLGLSEWVESHTIGSSNTYGLDTLAINHVVSPNSMVSQTINVDEHKGILLSGADYYSGKTTTRVLIQDGTNIISFSYINYLDSEMRQDFIAAVSSVRFGNKPPTTDNTLKQKLTDLIK